MSTGIKLFSAVARFKSREFSRQRFNSILESARTSTLSAKNFVCGIDSVFWLSAAMILSVLKCARDICGIENSGRSMVRAPENSGSAIMPSMRSPPFKSPLEIDRNGSETYDEISIRCADIFEMSRCNVSLVILPAISA